MMRVLYVQYTNPGAYPPLVRGAQILAESGAEVLMLGTRVFGTDALDVDPRAGLDVQLLPEAGDGWKLKAHFARYATWVVRQIATWKPDWLYASDLLSTPIALGFAVRGGRVVYHEHDAPVHEHESWVIKRCLDARQRLLRGATEVVTPNAARSARLSELAGGRLVHTVWNCPRRPAERRARIAPAAGLRAIFRGSINPSRLPLTVIDALARVGQPVSLDVVGYETAGSRGYVATLAAHARRLGIAERVRVHGAVPNATAAGLAEHCDIGLAFMPMESADENMRNMTGASNKVFEYLASGVTPLVSDLPDWRATFVEPGYALACNPRDPAAIARTLENALANRPTLDAIGDRGWQRLQRDWNYETQFAPVLQAIRHGALAQTLGVAGIGNEVECAS
jgi:glycosyltransferase involved in cell wall biosynthesis